MVTLKKFIKMRNADEKELDKIIESMSEQDAKAYLKAIMKVINKEFGGIDNLFSCDTEGGE